MKDGIAGLREGWRREGSIRLHLPLAIAGLAILIILRPGAAWLLVYGVLAVLGLAVELLNASIEALLDRLHPSHDREVGVAKDMGAAAALVVNLAALAVFAAALLS